MAEPGGAAVGVSVCFGFVFQWDVRLEFFEEQHAARGPQVHERLLAKPSSNRAEQSGCGWCQAGPVSVAVTILLAAAAKQASGDSISTHTLWPEWELMRHRRGHLSHSAFLFSSEFSHAYQPCLCYS